MRKENATQLERLRDEVKDLSGIDRALVDPLLVEVAAMTDFTVELREMVKEQGIMTEVQRGGANNVHFEMVENPAFTTYSKSLARLAEVAKKVSWFTKQADQSEDEDELVAFARR